ncbi:MAG: hypothetical protein ACHQT8_01460 [Chlamydiales bacterium]
MALPLTYSLARIQSNIGSQDLLRVALDNTIRTHVTFWGTRMVSIGDDSLPLEVIASVVLNVFRQRARENAQIYGDMHRAATNVEFFYVMTDLQILGANLITQIFVWIRDTFSISTRYALAALER